MPQRADVKDCEFNGTLSKKVEQKKETYWFDSLPAGSLVAQSLYIVKTMNRGCEFLNSQSKALLSYFQRNTTTFT